MTEVTRNPFRYTLIIPLVWFTILSHIFAGNVKGFLEFNMSDKEESNLPSAAECDARSKQFAAVTGTDTALAMFYLQDRKWDLEVTVTLIDPVGKLLFR